jgi:plasmid stabilization system protein ParE
MVACQQTEGARARNVALSGVRRLHLARVRYYIYYRVLSDPDRVEVLAFWHGSRGEGPPL